MLFTVYYAPFFDMCKEAWEKRNHPNMLFLFYEELLKVGIDVKYAFTSINSDACQISTSLPPLIQRAHLFFQKRVRYVYCVISKIKRICHYFCSVNYI